MMVSIVSIETACGALDFDLEVGNIPALTFHWSGRKMVPFFAAPWRQDPEVQADPGLPPVLRRLAGDFFCAPFATPADRDVPAHGWSANSRWTLEAREPASLVSQLIRNVSGATVTKTLHLAADAPLLYQEHVIANGSGILPVAHHPMVALAGQGTFSTSPKRVALTFPEIFEPGHSRLAYPARAADLHRFPAAGGGTVDLGHWPIGTQHEDFVVLVEAEQDRIGWSAVLREAEDDIVFFLKDAAILPVTMLWFSNGGRDFTPWNGRVTGVTGIEDGCCPALSGEAFAGRGNRIAAEGVPTGLPLAEGRLHRVRHVAGAIPRPAGWTDIGTIFTDGDRLVISNSAGHRVELAWRRNFFEDRTTWPQSNSFN